MSIQEMDALISEEIAKLPEACSFVDNHVSGIVTSTDEVKNDDNEVRPMWTPRTTLLGQSYTTGELRAKRKSSQC
jgi:hypothetical protein